MALTTQVNSKGWGVENIGLLDAKRLPDQALEELAGQMNDWESQGTLPWQSLPSIVNLAKKPGGGDRALGLLGWVYWLYIRARAGYVQQWSLDNAMQWDAALAGKSALMEAATRVFMDETARELGITSASFQWDVEAFYDSMQIVMTLKAALKLHFPPQLLGPVACAHMGPRLLRTCSAVSMPIWPTSSILAGCGTGPALASCLLNEALIVTNAQMGPRGVSSRAWIDNVTQRCEGTRARVIAQLAEAGDLFAKQIRNLNLVISGKSTVTASDVLMEKALRGAVAKGTKGWASVKIASVVEDLGIDRGRVAVRRRRRAGRRIHIGAKKIAKI